MAVHSGSIWLDMNWGHLPEGMWLAADASGSVTEAQTIDDLYVNLRIRQIKIDTVAIVYLPRRDEVLQ